MLPPNAPLDLMSQVRVDWKLGGRGIIWHSAMVGNSQLFVAWLEPRYLKPPFLHANNLMTASMCRPISLFQAPVLMSDFYGFIILEIETISDVYPSHITFILSPYSLITVFAGTYQFIKILIMLYIIYLFIYLLRFSTLLCDFSPKHIYIFSKAIPGIPSSI